MTINRQIILVSRPHGMLRESDFSLITSEVKYPGNSMLLVRTLYLSADPYMRGRMNEGQASFTLNMPLRGYGIGMVEETGDARFKKGDIVTGMMDWADYTVLKGDEIRLLHTFSTPLSASLGVLGLTGLTAYFGMLDIGKPRKGETALISAAAGAVGSVAGQIARIKGCRVAGITGSDEKAKIVREEFRFDSVTNYRKGNLGEELIKNCPNGVDIYFDNVGGEISDEVLLHLNSFARIIICGQISLYNLAEKILGPRPFPTLLFKSALAQGLMVNQHAGRFEEARLELSTWIKDGLLKSRETIVEGLEKGPKALIGLFKGENIGKQIVKVADR
jgi:NADPH:quinone reductase